MRERRILPSVPRSVPRAAEAISCPTTTYGARRTPGARLHGTERGMERPRARRARHAGVAPFPGRRTAPPVGPLRGCSGAVLRNRLPPSHPSLRTTRRPLTPHPQSRRTSPCPSCNPTTAATPAFSPSTSPRTCCSTPLAYAAQCHATLDNVVAVALGRLLDADKAEREAWLKEHPDAIEPARLKHYARGRRPPRARTTPEAGGAHYRTGVPARATARFGTRRERRECRRRPAARGPRPSTAFRRPSRASSSASGTRSSSSPRPRPAPDRARPLPALPAPARRARPRRSCARGRTRPTSSSGRRTCSSCSRRRSSCTRRALSLFFVHLYRPRESETRGALPPYEPPEKREQALRRPRRDAPPDREESASPLPQWLAIPEKGLYTGMACFGAIGSGKTSSFIRPVARELFLYAAHDPARRLGGIVLEVKGDFCEQVREILRSAGRGEDYLEIGLHTRYRYNPLGNQDLSEDALAYAITTLIANIYGRGQGPLLAHGLHERPEVPDPAPPVAGRLRDAHRHLPHRHQPGAPPGAPQGGRPEVPARRVHRGLARGLRRARRPLLHPQVPPDGRRRPLPGRDDLRADRRSSRSTPSPTTPSRCARTPRSTSGSRPRTSPGTRRRSRRSSTPTRTAEGYRAPATDEAVETLKSLRVSFETVAVDAGGTDADRQDQMEAVLRWFRGDWTQIDVKLRTSIVEGISVFLSLFDTNPTIRRIFCPPKETFDPARNRPEDGYPARRALPVVRGPRRGGKGRRPQLPDRPRPDRRQDDRDADEARLPARRPPADPEDGERPRRGPGPAHFRPTVFCCDEYQNFATVGETGTGDQNFFALSRQPKCIAIVATQSVVSLKSAISSDDADEDAPPDLPHQGLPQHGRRRHRGLRVASSAARKTACR